MLVHLSHATPVSVTREEQRKQAYMIASSFVIAKCCHNSTVPWFCLYVCWLFNREGFSFKVNGNTM